MTVLVRLAADLPLVPDSDEARRRAAEELSRPIYAAAEPTPFDRVAQAVGDFFARLFRGEAPAGWDGLLAVVLLAVVAVLVVAAFLVWGRPRALRRSHGETAELFSRDRRSAAQLRHDAADRASAQDWDAAIVLRFRALARGLAERGIVDPAPGATVHAFAREAGRAFPPHSARLEECATAFDDVRYLRRPGTPGLYALVVAADDALAAERPATLPELAELAR